MSRTVIVEQKSSRSGRTKTVTRRIEYELTQSMAKRMEKPRTYRAESLFKTNGARPGQTDLEESACRARATAIASSTVGAST